MWRVFPRAHEFCLPLAEHLNWDNLALSRDRLPRRDCVKMFSVMYGRVVAR